MSKSTPSGIPGVNMMTDTFDFFKNMWGSVPGMNMPGVNIPGMVMPSLSVEEIDKQIKDLKAVESWLGLNMSMLQGTIQALEVQKATISTLQSMGETFSAAMQPPPMPAAAEDKPAFQSPFTASASSAASAAEKPAEQAPPGEKPAAEGSDTGAMPGVPPLANPAAWWNMLQDQFKQAVDTAAAMTPDPGAATAAAPAPEAATSSGKPATKKAATKKAAAKKPAKKRPSPPKA